MIDDDSSDVWESLGIDQKDLPEVARAKPRPLNGNEVQYDSQEAIQEEFVEEPAAEYQEEPEQALQQQYSAVQPLTEVEKRLQKAVLYQQWVQGNLYSNQNECTIEVEQEFKEFALSRLNNLIGLTTAETTKQDVFNNVEVQILKALVTAIIENKDMRMSLLGSLSKKPNTTVAKVEQKQPIAKPATTKKPVGRPPKASAPAVKPTPKPVVAAPIPVAKPKLRTMDVPQEVQASSVVQQPVVKPVQKPVTSNIVAQPKPSLGVNKVLPDNTEFEENGKKYRIKWIQTNSLAFGPSKEATLDRMPQKSTLKISDILLYKTEGDEIYKIIKQDLSPKEIPVNAVPFPENMTTETLKRAMTAAESGQGVFAQKIGK